MLLARYLCSFSSGKHRSMARHTEATESPCLHCLFSVWVHHNDGLLGGALPGVDPTPGLAIPYSTHWSPGQCTLELWTSTNQNIPYGQPSAKLPVIRSSGHLVIRSSGHLVIRSFCHYIIPSSYYPIIMSSLFSTLI